MCVPYVCYIPEDIVSSDLQWVLVSESDFFSYVLKSCWGLRTKLSLLKHILSAKTHSEYTQPYRKYAPRIIVIAQVGFAKVM